MRIEEAVRFDRCYLKEGLLCGVDEAGRGCLAGPVVAAAVVFDVARIPLIPVDDSKRLSPERREELFTLIKELALDWAIGVVGWATIDSINIKNAALLAMKRAVCNLKMTPHLVLVDGNLLPEGLNNAVAVVKGDAKSFCVAAASIVAKVVRDRLMEKYAGLFPFYAFDRNKGYPTSFHRKSVVRYGPCPIHRRSFLKGLTRKEEVPIKVNGAPVAQQDRARDS